MGILRSSEQLRELGSQSDPPRFLRESQIPDSGLLYDYDAQQETYSAGTISTITDQAGSNDATGTVSFVESGINGLPSYSFDGTETANADDPATLGPNEEYTFAVVIEEESTSEINEVFYGGSNGGYGLQVKEDESYNFTHAGISNNEGGTPGTAPHVIIGAYDGTNLIGEVDNIEIVNTSTGIDTPDGEVQIASRDSEFASENYVGEIGHLRLYDEYYNASERAALHDALATYWGF